jgi:hypothetical protein
LASLLPLLFLLFVGLIGLFRLCRARFRQNGGFGASFRRNTFGFSAISTFLSLYGFLLLTLSLCRFYFRLNSGSWVGFSAPPPFFLFLISPVLSFSVSFSSACYISLSLSPATEWWLWNMLSLFYLIFLLFIVFDCDAFASDSASLLPLLFSHRDKAVGQSLGELLLTKLSCHWADWLQVVGGRVAPCVA